jgi:hypothetical protein
MFIECTALDTEVGSGFLAVIAALIHRFRPLTRRRNLRDAAWGIGLLVQDQASA